MKRIGVTGAIILASLNVGFAQEQPADNAYLDVRVDNLEINTYGLVDASNNLSASIDRLSKAFEQLAKNNEAFTTEEKQMLLDSVASVDRASRAVEDLAGELPEMSNNLANRLPELIEQTRAPVSELSGGLHSASASVTNIVEHLPEATENVKQIVDAALNSAVKKMTIFVVIVLVVFALVLILVFHYLYKSYIEPVVELLAPLKNSPEHLESLSRHMKETSDNLLLMKGNKRGHSFIGMPPRST